MKCPLMVNKQINHAGSYGSTERVTFGDCIEEQCAWYDSTNLDCSVRTIARCQHSIRVDGFKLTFKED